jgi:hypothetical protein
MDLPPLTRIDLDAFEDACLSFVSLSRTRLGPGASILDPEFEDKVEEAVEGFARYVSDRFDEEATIRHALAWLLNLDEERFARTTAALDISFPVNGDFATLHRFFELLWDGSFADWRIPRFDPDEYDVKGLPFG